MTGFTLIWFNWCQLWAPSRCLFFSGHLDRLGPDNAQRLEILLDMQYLISEAVGVLYQKCLFPGTGSHGELCRTMWHICWFVGHTCSVNIQLVFKYARGCTSVWHRSQIRCSALVFEVRESKWLIPTLSATDISSWQQQHAGGGYMQSEMWTDLMQEPEAQRQAEAPSMNASRLNAVVCVSSTGSRSF